MKDSICRIALDINEHGSQAVVKAKRMDTGRKLHIVLRAGGTPYTIENDCYAVFKATKPDGSILYNACAIDNNEIIYEFTEQTCTSVGRCRCEIALYGLNGALITSPRFVLLVDGTVYPDDWVASTDEFAALVELVENARKSSSDAEKAAESANNAAENANRATNIVTEAGKDIAKAVTYTKQNPTDEEKEQARNNIGAVTEADVVAIIDAKLSAIVNAEEVAY